MKMYLREFTTLKYKVMFCDEELGQKLECLFDPIEWDEWETIHVDDTLEYDVNLWIDEDPFDETIGRVRFCAYRYVPDSNNPMNENGERFWTTDKMVCSDSCKESSISVC